MTSLLDCLRPQSPPEPKGARLVSHEDPKPPRVPAVYVKDKAKRNARERTARAAKREPKVCGHCGTVFTPSHTLAGYCSGRCKWQAHWRRNADRKAKTGAGEAHSRSETV